MSTEPTNKFDDGGCAFPEIEYGSSGMTLRDYFAAQALGNAETRVPDTCCQRYELAINIAAFSYEVADAMIAKRKEVI
jgi:hypothetical protein